MQGLKRLLVVLAVLAAAYGLLYLGFGRERFKEESYTANERVTAVKVEDANNGIEVYPSPDGSTQVKYSRGRSIQYDISLSEGRLDIRMRDRKRWYERLFRWVPDRQPVRLYLPASMGQLNLITSNAEVSVSRMSELQSLSAQTSNGAIRLSAVYASASIDLHSSNAALSLENLSTPRQEARSSNGASAWRPSAWARSTCRPAMRRSGSQGCRPWAASWPRPATAASRSTGSGATI